MRWIFALAVLASLLLPYPSRALIILPTAPAVSFTGAGLQAKAGAGNCLEATPGFCLLAAPSFVAVACGTTLSTVINSSSPSGTTYQLAGSGGSPCTYSGQTFHTASNIIIQGDCTSSTGANTILDGGSANVVLTDGHADSTTGVTVKCLTVQHYYTHSTNCENGQLTTYDNWLVTQDTFTDAGCVGIDIKGAAALSNSLVTANGTMGVFVEPGYSALGSSAKATIQGNEISHNNSAGDALGASASGLKIVPDACAEIAVEPQGATVQFNYVHDNDGQGLWSDCWASNIAFLGNTVASNAAAGIMCEISDGCDIENNVLHLNGTASGSGLYQGDIFVSSSSNTTAKNNFVEVSNSYTRNGGPIVQADCRSDVPLAEVNDNIDFNTVVFDGYTSGQGVVGQNDTTNLGANCPSDKHPAAWTYYSSLDNLFFSTATTDPHWTGNAQGYFTNETLAAIQGAPYNNDIGSTIAVSADAPTAAGCTAIGCTSSGWPTAALGSYVGGGFCAKLGTLATWLNFAPTANMYLLDYLIPYNNGNTDTVIQALAGCNTGQRIELSLAIGTESQLGPIDTYANMIGGGDDTYYQEVATQLAAHAPNAILRLGWEMNEPFFAWGITGGAYGFTAAQYIAVFDHFVTVMRAAGLPNSVRIEWNSALCPGAGCSDSYGAAVGYPGDAYVDIVGIDAYETVVDGSSGGWATYWTSCAKNCLGAQVAFAKAHGKALGLGEWGVGYISSALNDTQAPYIIGQMKSWLNNTAGANGYQPYVYFDYWDSNASYCGILSGEPTTGLCPSDATSTPSANGPPYQLPNSAAAFLAAFAVP